MSELKHAGILGMKWGKHKIKSTSTVTKSEDHVRTQKLKKKKMSEMTNTELKDLTNRLQLEKQYKDLSKSQMSSGKKFVSDTLKEVGKDLLKNTIKTGVTGAIKASKKVK